MARPTTYKTVQIHQECSCGHNIVDEQEMQIRFKDLAQYGIRYKKDPATGEYFFTKKEHRECSGHEDGQY